MRPQIVLVGNQLVHPHDPPPARPRPPPHTTPPPARTSRPAHVMAGVGGEDIGGARRHHRLEDRPHGGEVGGVGGAAGMTAIDPMLPLSFEESCRSTR